MAKDAARPETAGTEDREARIAALRARRRARLRWLATRSLLGMLALVVVAIALGWFLFNTFRGRDVLLGQIVARLPDGNTLTWARAEGPASGPMVLHDVEYVHLGCPERDGQPIAWPGCVEPLRTVFRAKRVELDPTLQPLLGRRLRLEALRIVDATLQLPERDEPFELPRWPASLPAIAPPLALEAENIAVDRMKIVRDEDGRAMPLIDVRTLRGGLVAEDGALRLERLQADTDRGRFALHGDYAPRDRYRMDLTASALLPAPAGRTPARLGLVARGDLRALDVALAGAAPAPVRARLRLQGEDAPRWSLVAKAEGLTTAALLGDDDDTRYVFDLKADGVGGAANVQGRVARGDLAATVRPSKLSIEDQRLRLAPLTVDMLGGLVSANGRADFTDPADARFDGRVSARGLRWQGDTRTTEAIEGDGDFAVSGRLRDWRADGEARLRRGTERATLALKARGDAASARFDTLRATMPSGRLDGRGTLAWMPTLRWQAEATLAGFDPGYLFPDWPGAVNGALRSTGDTRRDGGLDVRVEANALGGRLRGGALGGRANVLARLPASAAGEAARTDYEGDVALTLGASRIDAKGRIADAFDIDATFSPLRLNDLLPTAQGTLRGDLRLRGPRTRPDVEVDLAGEALRYDDWRADTLRARGRLPWRAGAAGALDIDGTGVDAGLAFARLRLQARGAVEALRIEGDADADIGRLELAAELSKRGAQWAGTLAALRFAPTNGPAWALRAPAAFAATPSPSGLRLRIPSSCFATASADAAGELCADIDWPTRADVRGAALPLALLTPYLPERERGEIWRLRGAFDVDAQVRPRGASWSGTARVRSVEGGLSPGARARREILGYRDLALDARFDPQRIETELGAALTPNGRIDARIASGWDGDAPLQGTIDIDTRALAWLELFSPDIVEPQGHLQGRIALAGTRARPALGGQARLEQFRAELPALALSLRDGELRFDAQPDGTAILAGRVRSGEGTLRVDGSLGWRGDDTPLRLAVTGEDVLVSDTRQLRAVVDPSVVVRYVAGQPIAVTGRVRIDSATLDLERLDAGVSASEDVVVLDPANPERGARTPLDLDLVLEAGDDVRLHGFGLDGSLGGSVRMRARPGRETTATGSLEVEGRYRAYGQNLRITRGRLLWSNTAFSDPVIDVRAERVVGPVTAGIDVTGRASSPEAQVWSDPATSESEALSYLALGRPLSSATADENRQLSAASAALSAGNLLASQLGARIGLDDAGVSESRALGGTVVGVGKYLSPRLYVGYGVSLLGTGQVLTLKYLLRKGFDIEIESSTVENRGSVNWRKEK
ncbi:MAG: translocation/assembly module TamB domain-containing protein [Pseudomonadota bacterium]